MKFCYYLTPCLKLLADRISIAYHEDWEIVSFEQKHIRFGTFWELIGQNEILPLFDTLFHHFLTKVKPITSEGHENTWVLPFSGIKSGK